ncbi:MAG: hypothetical protein R2877_02260 [Bdellovibrionota bacterium]
MAEAKKGKALPFPDITVALIKANDNFVKLFPTDAKIAGSTISARLYYNYNHFAEAEKAFNDVINKYPNSNTINRAI